MFLFDSGYLLVMLFALVVGGAAQFYVNSSFRRFSRVPLATGQTGAEVARRMLDEAGLGGVRVEATQGRLSDHYDPRVKVLRLSPDVYGGRSVSAAGVAAHEAGHAVQHARAFAVFSVRQALVPVAQIGSQAWFYLILLGMFLRFPALMQAGVWLFAGVVLFQLVTLPVEFDASRRALGALSGGGTLPADQVSGARTVLTAAALTYVAAALVAVVQLLYFLGLSRRN